MPFARNDASSATQSCSIGSFRRRSYSALRGWNHARSLFWASSARKSIASGENPPKVDAAMVMTDSWSLGCVR